MIRLWSRRAAALVVAALLSVLVLPQAPVAAQPAAKPGMTVVDQTTWVARNTDFTMTLDVHDTPAGAKVSTTVYQALDSRKAFDDSLGKATLEGPMDADLPSVSVDSQPLLPSGGRAVPIRFRVRDGGTPGPGSVEITQFGVHPVEVQVTAADGSTLARLVTHLVRLPDPGDETKPVVTSLVLPVGAPPALQLNGSIQFTPADRTRLKAIGDALALNPDVPVSLSPTPETIVGLGATGDPTDATTLQHLKGAANGNQVLADTYVDLDPSSWLASGLDQDLSGQQLLGAGAVQDRLDVAPSASVAIAQRNLSPAALARASGAGSRLLVPEGALAPLPADQIGRTLTRSFQLTSGTTTATAFLIDSKLQAAFDRHPDDPVLAAHEILAELATIFADDTSSVQGVVLLPPSNFVASYPFLDALLDGLHEGTPVVVPTAVDGVFGYVPAAGQQGQAVGGDEPLVRTLAGRPVPSLGSYPAHLRTAQGLLANLRSMVGPTDRQAVALSNQLLVSGSTDLSRADRVKRTDQVRDVANAELSQIEIPDSQTITLASNSADIPLTIRNGLDRKATVTVRFHSTSKRLELPDGESMVADLAPQTSTRISVRIRTRGSGVSPLQITVSTPDGRQLQSTRYKVQSTAVSGVGLIITIGAALFLVLWWGRHLYKDRQAKRGRHARGAKAAAKAAEPEPADA